MNLSDRRILAGHIKYVREVLGENFVEFAQRLGVKVSDVCSFEIATKRPDADASEALHQAAIKADLPGLVKYFAERALSVREFQEARERARAAAFPSLYKGGAE